MNTSSRAPLFTLLTALALTIGLPARAQNSPPVLDIQALVNEAVRTNQTTLRIPPGPHLIPSERLEITGAKGLTIDGSGSTWYFSNKTGNAINVRASKNLTLRNFNVDYAVLPFTQATVTSVSADNATVEFRIHDGYPRFTKEYAVHQTHVFDPGTRRWKASAPDIYSQKVEVLSPETGRLQLKASQAALKPIQVGDMLVFNIRNGSGISIRGSESTRVEDVNVYSALGLAVSARFVSGDNYFRFNVARGPRPAGATEDRLFSTNADAFNYAYSRKGPVVEKCDFAWMGDDSINIHGVTLPVLRVDSPTVFWTARPYGNEEFGDVIQPGDTLRILAPDNFAIKSEIALATWERGEPNHAITPEEIRRFWAASKGEKITFYKVTLKQPGAPAVGDWFDIPAIAAPNYVIRDSYFHDHRARGLRLKSNHGLVTGNRLERIKQVAITLGPGYAFWREAGWVQDVEVSNNIIRDVATDPMVASIDSSTPGAISIFAQTEVLGAPYAAFNRNIRVINNTISGTPVAGIHVNGANGVLLKGNTISGTNSGDTAATGSRIGLSANYAVSINNSRAVTLEANQISQPGKYQKGPVQPAG